MQNYLHNFTRIYEKELDLHKVIDENNIRLVHGEYRKLLIVDIMDMNNEEGRGNLYPGNIKKYPHTEHLDDNVRFYYQHQECIVYPYLNYKSKEEMSNENIYYIRRYNQFLNLQNLNKISLVAKLEKERDKYFIVYYFNSGMIEDICTNKRQMSKHMFINILTSQKKENLLKKSINELTFIQNNTNNDIFYNLEINASLLKRDISLFNYQKMDIMWMKEIENKILNKENTIHFNYSYIFEILNGDYILYDENILPKSLINKNYHNNLQFKYYGGNLISDVGLGKTLIALYHILSNDITERNRINNFVNFDVCCNYFFKRGPRKGSYCSKEPDENNLYCKEHKKTLFVDKRVLKYKNLIDFKIDDFRTTGIQGLIKTNATLVICPNQLCDQWVNEYYDKFNNNHRIIHLVTYDQLINLTLGDFIFADIVIVSYNFLLNSNYVKSKNIFNTGYLDKHFKIDENENISYETAINKLLNSKIFNILHLYEWKRIFLDEAHEIENRMKSNVLKNEVINFKSLYKWNITGTPFTNSISSFINLLSYNTTYNKNSPLLDNINNKNYFYINSLGFNDNIIERCKSLFRKNTKESVKKEYEGNIIKEFMKKLIFTTHERAIYNSYVNGSNQKHYDFLIKLCCHSELYDNTKALIKNCKTFEEIQRVLLDYNKTRLTKEKMEKMEVENEIINLERQLNILEMNLFDNEFNINLIKSHITSKKRHLTSVKKNVEIIERTYNYLKAAIESLNNEETTCPICLDNIEKGQVTITKCGHKFCWDCIFETHKSKGNYNNFKCPSCNTMLTTNEIYLINEKTTNELNDLENLIHTIKSTKIGNIIHFLKNDTKTTDKIILFSQWDELLHKVGDILSEYKVKIVYCQGSVYQRKRAISSFQKDPNIQIIMLSSRNAASGINLTIANKIILLEPVYGSSEYRKNIEEQAIGRADRIGQKSPIDVYRFIIQDTIEEDIINNIENSNIKSLTI